MSAITEFQGTDGATRANFNERIQEANAEFEAQDSILSAHEADAVAHVTQADHDKITAAATKSTLATATLPASGWTGGEAPYSQTVTVAGAKPEPTRIEVQPTTDATAAQWAAWRAALIRGGGQGTDSITLLADGDKPEIDIPIAVTIRGDVS
ncbi:hypothetical protein [Clostridium sp. KNHs216]|uniref:hypothetical protein n=1 Tax=Clostridium sp. KNHs216 TaxID=1550235 RepID=UPI00114F29BF|nr:hypothetical protein [Clostridium sp. KNHs216]TQI69016.1 hypothetical protein LY85_3765 [Clostridium sp. KNHs216]